MKLSYLKQAWLVLVLAVCFGAALALVQMGLQSRIESNKLNETISQVSQLVPGAEKAVPVDLKGRNVFQALDSTGVQIGWIIPSSGQGFADRIEVLIGTDSKVQKITGLYVLDQKETPGLGNKIVEEKWRAQFTGKDTETPVKCVKSSTSRDDEISAVTGATISSESVCSIVNTTVDELKNELSTYEAKVK